MGIGLQTNDWSADWYTFNADNVQNLVNSKWKAGTSDDHGANFPESVRIIMGRFQDGGSK